MLTKQELEYMVRFIDVTAARGGIKGDELSSAGMIRQRLIDVAASMEDQPEPQQTTSKKRGSKPEVTPLEETSD